MKHLIIVLLLVILLNTYVTKKLNKNGQNTYNGKCKLKDIGHHILPDLQDYRFIENILPAIVFLMILFNKNNINLNELITVMIILVVVRMISIQLTVFPCPQNKYKKDHDMMFSGHTAVTTMMILYLIQIYPKYKIPLLCLALVEGTIMISTRSHYTVDVYIGYLITMLLYTNREKLDLKKIVSFK